MSLECLLFSHTHARTHMLSSSSFSSTCLQSGFPRCTVCEAARLSITNHFFCSPFRQEIASVAASNVACPGITVTAFKLWLVFSWQPMGKWQQPDILTTLRPPDPPSDSDTTAGPDCRMRRCRVCCLVCRLEALVARRVGGGDEDVAVATGVSSFG